jgi:phosphopantetheine--protein transferase-like protein
MRNMLFIPPADCIRCYFDSESKAEPGLQSGELKVFFAITKDLSPLYSYLENYLTYSEHLKADKFLYTEDKETYTSSHSLLRLFLANELNSNPLDIPIIIDKNKKPGLAGNPVYFNLTHTRDAFAFVISKESYVGIDLEEINCGMDFYSIIETFFSPGEREFILQSQIEIESRFFLLWTRKEAFLKALGTGIIDNLTEVEVSGRENFVNKHLFANSTSVSPFNDHFIYSKRLWDYYISIAIPCRARIKINHLNTENIASYLDLATIV